MNKLLISQNLKSLRGHRTQEDIAASLNISQQAYSRYENGVAVPNDYVKERIAKLYKKRVGEIFYGE